MDLLELAKKVGAAEADRWLDADIHEAVTTFNCRRAGPGWPDEDEYVVPAFPGWVPLPAYTASLDAALTLVPEGAGVTLSRYWVGWSEGPVWSAELATGGVPDSPREVFDCYDAASPALALTAAALCARAAQAMSAGTAKTAKPVEGDSPPARSEGCAQTSPQTLPPNSIRETK